MKKVMMFGLVFILLSSFVLSINIMELKCNEGWDRIGDTKCIDNNLYRCSDCPDSNFAYCYVNTEELCDLQIDYFETPELIDDNNLVPIPNENDLEIEPIEIEPIQPIDKDDDLINVPLICSAQQTKVKSNWIGPHGIYFTKEACCLSQNMCAGPYGDNNCYSSGHTWSLASFPNYFNEQISWKCNDDGDWQVWTEENGYYCLKEIEEIEEENSFNIGEIPKLNYGTISIGTPPTDDDKVDLKPINIDNINPINPIIIKYTCPTGSTCNQKNYHCVETSCTDNKDNNGNGLIDCEDPNCNYRVCGNNKICYKGRCTEEAQPDIFYYTQKKIVQRSFEDVFKDIIESAQLFKNINEDCRSFCQKRGMYSAFGEGIADRCTCIKNG
jgi:hypothetical protein